MREPNWVYKPKSPLSEMYGYWYVERKKLEYSMRYIAEEVVERQKKEVYDSHAWDFMQSRGWEPEPESTKERSIRTRTYFGMLRQDELKCCWEPNMP